MEIHGVEAARHQAAIANEDIAALSDKIRFRRNPIRLATCYSHLGIDHVSLAVHAFFVEGDIHRFKQNMHVASLLKIAAVETESYQRFTVGDEIFCALLSDNPVVIDSVARLEPRYFIEGRSNPLHSEFRVHMYQLAILGDYEQLQVKIERLAKNGRKKDRELPTLRKDFFSLLMDGDKQGLEELISRDALVKSKDVLTEDFMCFQGAIEAKICWMKGIQVQIVSPLLPMALMPLQPLDHYDDVYDFLAPGYVPPKVGWLERLRYQLKERAQFKESTKRALEANNKR
ncbi:MAG: Imm49 family immunity protein [Pseudomonadota bacterium]